MKINIKNKTSSNQRLCFVPKTGAEVVLPNPEVNPTINIHETGEVYLCLTPTKMGISCVGATEVTSWVLNINDITRNTGATLSISVNGVTGRLTIPDGLEFSESVTYPSETFVLVNGVGFVVAPMQYGTSCKYFIIAAATETANTESRITLTLSEVGDGIKLPLLGGAAGVFNGMSLNPTNGIISPTVGVACLKYSRISCYGATSNSGCINLEGDYDFYVNDVLVATDINSEEMPTDLTTDDFLVNECLTYKTYSVLWHNDVMNDTTLPSCPINAPSLIDVDLNSYARNEEVETADMTLNLKIVIDDEDVVYDLNAPAQFPISDANSTTPTSSVTIANKCVIEIYPINEDRFDWVYNEGLAQWENISVNDSYWRISVRSIPGSGGVRVYMVLPDPAPNAVYSDIVPQQDSLGGEYQLSEEENALLFCISDTPVSNGPGPIGPGPIGPGPIV